MSCKKGIVPVVVVSLLLVVCVVSIIVFGDFYNSYLSGFYADIQSQKSANVKIDSVFGEDLYIVNNEGYLINISKVKVNGVDCNFTGNLSSGLNRLNISRCLINITGRAYEVIVITQDEIYNKYLYNGNNVGVASFVGNITINYTSGSSCDVDFVRLYGINATSESHAEIGSSSNYYISVCASHETYTIGTDCMASVSERLFYLGDTTNSHIYVDNSTAYDMGPGYYDWQEVCISLDGGTLELARNVSDMSSEGYSCIGSYVKNDTYGGVIGDCSQGAYTKMWVKVS